MTIGRSPGEVRRYELAIRFFLIGQIVFFVSLLVCILLLPQGLTANGGFTYYGKQHVTMLPYRLAYLVSGVFVLLSAVRLPNNRPFRAIQIGFLLMLPLLLGLAFTASWAQLISRIHVSMGTSLFVLQLVINFWLAAVIRPTPSNTVLFILQLAGAFISLLSLLEIIPYLLQGQILFELAFGALMTSALIGLRTEVTRGGQVQTT